MVAIPKPRNTQPAALWLSAVRFPLMHARLRTALAGGFVFVETSLAPCEPRHECSASVKRVTPDPDEGRSLAQSPPPPDRHVAHAQRLRKLVFGHIFGGEV
jgi:hypothetical protein